MPTYKIQVRPEAAKSLSRLPKEIQVRILTALRRLAQDPRGPGSVKLRDHASEYRTRVGDYRIVYAIYDDVLAVLVMRIAHRKDAYRP